MIEWRFCALVLVLSFGDLGKYCPLAKGYICYQKVLLGDLFVNLALDFLSDYLISLFILQHFEIILFLLKKF